MCIGEILLFTAYYMQFFTVYANVSKNHMQYVNLVNLVS